MISDFVFTLLRATSLPKELHIEQERVRSTRNGDTPICGSDKSRHIRIQRAKPHEAAERFEN